MSAAWERQPGEPARWHERFVAYRDAGAGRSLAATHRALGARVGPVPAVWYDAFERWQWRERATAFDADRAEAAAAAERERAERARTERVAVLKAARGKALTELRDVTLTDAAWPRVMAALADVTRQLRAEGA